MQTFFMYVVIIILMTPLMLFYGLPFIAAAWLLYRFTPGWLGERVRLIAASAIAALGIAPAFDDFLLPKSIYLVWSAGDTVNPWAALLSFVLTWLVVSVNVGKLAHRRSPEPA